MDCLGSKLMVVGSLILFRFGSLFLLGIVKPTNKVVWCDQKNNEDDQIIIYASFASLKP